MGSTVPPASMCARRSPDLVRHPMHTLAEGLQVKYQDVIARRDAVARLDSALAAGQPPANRLSPQELDELNRRADQLFDAGDVVGYARLVGQLADAGHLTPQELQDHVAAVTRRAHELSTAAVPPRSTAGAAPSKERLLSLLTTARGDAGDATAHAHVPADVVAAAKQVWADAASRLAAPSSAAAAQRGLLAAVTRALQRLSSPAPGAAKQQGAAPAAVEAQRLPAQLAAGQLTSWEQACRAWGSFLAAAGAAEGSPSAPTLAEVVQADAELRAARAAAAAAAPASAAGGGAAAAEAGERLRRAEARADELNAALDGLYAAWAAGGRATWPLPALGGGDGGGAEVLAGLRRFNASLDVSDPGQLLGSFMVRRPALSLLHVLVTLKCSSRP